MSLREQLLEDMKDAMRGGADARVRLSTIRMVRAAIQNREIELGRELDDDEVRDVLAREVRQRQESRSEYERAGRDASVAELDEEIAVLRSYLPEPLGEDQLRQLAAMVIDEVGANGPQDIGRVMGALMPQVRARADGSEVNSIVRELLQG